jgi:hypothetical protein
LKIYNGSVYKPQVLNFNLSPGINSINITTKNGSIKQYFRAGQVAYTAKNIAYMNLTKTDHYEQSGGSTNVAVTEGHREFPITKVNDAFIS